MADSSTTYPAEFLTFGKIVETVGGRTVPNAEQKVTSRSRGIDKDFKRNAKPHWFTRPARMDPDSIDPDFQSTGALVFREPGAMFGADGLAIAYRLRFLSEGGENEPGRMFTLITSTAITRADWDVHGPGLVAGGFSGLNCQPDTRQFEEFEGPFREPINLMVLDTAGRTHEILSLALAIIDSLANSGKAIIGRNHVASTSLFFQAVSLIIELAPDQIPKGMGLTTTAGFCNPGALGDLEYVAHARDALRPVDEALVEGLKRQIELSGPSSLRAACRSMKLPPATGDRDSAMRIRFSALLSTIREWTGGNRQTGMAGADMATQGIHRGARTPPDMDGLPSSVPPPMFHDANGQDQSRIPNLDWVTNASGSSRDATHHPDRTPGLGVSQGKPDFDPVVPGNAVPLTLDHLRLGQFENWLGRADMRNQLPDWLISRFAATHWMLFPEEIETLQKYPHLHREIDRALLSSSSLEHGGFRHRTSSISRAPSGKADPRLVVECLRFRMHRGVMPPPAVRLYPALDLMAARNNSTGMALDAGSELAVLERELQLALGHASRQQGKEGVATALGSVLGFIRQLRASREHGLRAGASG